jgi:hypothetical protein
MRCATASHQHCNTTLTLCWPSPLTWQLEWCWVKLTCNQFSLYCSWILNTDGKFILFLFWLWFLSQTTNIKREQKIWKLWKCTLVTHYFLLKYWPRQQQNPPHPVLLPSQFIILIHDKPQDQSYCSNFNIVGIFELSQTLSHKVFSAYLWVRTAKRVSDWL